MIFRELSFNNFLVFKGVNRIVFPSPEKHESSLILILAPNSGGKTSVIRGLEFLIYGRLRRDMPASVDELINKAYVRAATDNSVLDAWVQAKIDIGGKTVTVRRRLEARKNPTNSRANVFLEQIVHSPKGDVFKIDEGRSQRSLNHLVPDSLFDYFYFQGETLAQQLIQGGGNATIPKGLATLLHEDTWREAIDTVEKVGRRISTEMQELESASSEYKRIDATREHVKAGIRKLQAELALWQERESQAQTDFDNAELQIRTLGAGRADQNVTAELDRKRGEERAAELKFGQLDARISATVAESKGLPFFRAAFGPALTHLEQMKRDNILPADVSDGFVSRLLGSASCICGRPLMPEPDFAKERSSIEEYRKRTLAVDLNSGLLSLLNRLDERIHLNLQAQIAELRRQAESQLAGRDEIVLKQIELREAVRALEDKRASSNVDAIVAEQIRQKNAYDRRSAAVGKQKELEFDIRSLDAREKQLKRELDEGGKQGAGSQLAKLRAMRDRAHELQELIEKSLGLLKSSFHAILQRSVEKYYNPKATDNSQAFIDPKTLLPQIRRNGKLLTALGGGQRQLLVLAHIISLAELRRDLHVQLDELGIKTGKLDDQSFFLDSIFAPCDPAYARDVAAFLPGKARQMVLLVARQQWYEEIRSEIEPHVQKVFAMRLHSNNQERPPDEYMFPFRDKRLNLFTRIPAAAEPYTLIEEIK